MSKNRLVYIPRVAGQVACALADGKYIETVNHWTMAREAEVQTPNGNTFTNHWVLRDVNGGYIDHDRYRHDLMERYDFHTTPLTLDEYLSGQLA